MKKEIVYNILNANMTRSYPINIGIGTLTMRSIKKILIREYIDMLAELNIEHKIDYENPEITFLNGSKIIFCELQYLESDPNYDRFGGLLLTYCNVLPECENIKGVEILQSRCGRFHNRFCDKPKDLMNVEISLDIINKFENSILAPITNRLLFEQLVILFYYIKIYIQTNEQEYYKKYQHMRKMISEIYDDIYFYNTLDKLIININKLIINTYENN